MINSAKNIAKSEQHHWVWHLLLVIAAMFVIFSQSINQEFVKQWLISVIHSDGIKEKYFDFFKWVLLGMAAGCIGLWFFRKSISDDLRSTVVRWKKIPARVDASAVIPAVNASWLKKFLWLLLPIWALGITISLIPGYEAWAARLTLEKGVFQTLTVVLYLFAGIIALKLSFPLFRRYAQNGLLRWWLLVLALGCLFVAGEETKWGDVYINYNIGESIRELNAQDDISLHNIALPFVGYTWANTLLQILAVCGGVILPLLLWASNSFRRWMIAIEAPLPPWISQAYFFVAALIPQDKVLQMQPANIPSELREITVAIGIAIWLWYIMQNRHKVSRSPLRVENDVKSPA